MIPATKHAGRLERFFAYLVDFCILLFLGNVLTQLGGPGSPLEIVGSFLIWMGYYTAFESSRWQASPGKRLVGIYVCRTNGQALRERDALERFLAFSIPTLLIYLSIIPFATQQLVILWLHLAWFLPILLRKDARGMQDMLCEMQVRTGRL